MFKTILPTPDPTDNGGGIDPNPPTPQPDPWLSRNMWWLMGILFAFVIGLAVGASIV